jgi:polyribonucleotide nucleotidyltransferase
MISNGSDIEKESMANDFIAFTRTKSEPTLESYQDPNSAFKHSDLRQINPDEEMTRLKQFTAHETYPELDPAIISRRRHDLSAQNDSIKSAVNNSFDLSKHRLGSHQNDMQTAFQGRHDALLTSKVYAGPDKSNELINNFQIRDKPFWMSEDEQ